MLGKLRILAVIEVQHVVRLIHAVSSLYRARIKYWLLVELIKIKQKPGWIYSIFPSCVSRPERLWTAG